MVRYPDPEGVRPTKGATNMKKLALSLAVLAAILLPALYAAPAHATTYIQTWISHDGNDANTCQEVDPCRTFSGALSKTSQSGVVGCLDSGEFNYFSVTTLSVTVNCSGTMATNSILGGLACTLSAVTINAPGTVVTLRGLNLNGGSFTNCPVHGILIQAAMAVYIEDCVIENFSQAGILDVRTSGLTKLAIKNTIVRNGGSAGIVAAAASRNSVVLENVQSVGNAFGIAVATGNNVMISRSVMSENSIAGIEADSGAGVLVENTKISHNVSYGILAQGNVALANSDITFNTSSISGSTTSFGNNRLFRNGGGTAPTPAGGSSTDFGQQ
jgi:hypothetical protein